MRVYKVATSIPNWTSFGLTALVKGHTTSYTLFFCFFWIMFDNTNSTLENPKQVDSDKNIDNIINCVQADKIDSINIFRNNIEQEFNYSDNLDYLISHALAHAILEQEPDKFLNIYDKIPSDFSQLRVSLY